MLNCKLWFEPTRIWQIRKQYTTYDRQGSNTLVLSDVLLFLFVKGPFPLAPVPRFHAISFETICWLQYKAAELTAAGKRHYATAAALNGELSDDATIRVWWR